MLRRSFEENAYPDRKELDRIGAEVGMEVKWLKNWYHSQRKKKNVRKETTKTEDIKQEVEEDGGEPATESQELLESKISSPDLAQEILESGPNFVLRN